MPGHLLKGVILEEERHRQEDRHSRHSFSKAPSLACNQANKYKIKKILIELPSFDKYYINQIISWSACNN
jgi:hypothetical protein